MTLQTGKAKDIPQGYVQLTRSEAVKFQLNLIKNLSQKWNRFFIEYGPIASASVVSLSAVHIHYLYRDVVNIGLYKNIHTFGPVVALPTLSVFFLHKELVRNDIIIQKWSCPLCYHFRSSLIQTFFGLVTPVFFGSFSSFILARRWKLYDVPPINNGKAIWNFFLKKSKPYFNLFGYIAVGHLIIGTVIAHMEAKQNNDFKSNFEALKKVYDEKQKLNALKINNETKSTS